MAGAEACASPERKRQRMSCTTAELMLRESLVVFFSDAENDRALAALLVDRDPGSLRDLDRFIRRRARFERVRVRDDRGNAHDLYMAYKAALRSYQRQYFDASRRKPETQFFLYSRTQMVRTSVAQLNFARWLIRFGALEAYRAKNVAALK